MIKIESDGLKILEQELASMPVNLKKEMRIAAWKAQKRGRNEVARRIAKDIKQPAKRLKGASYAKMLPEGKGFMFIIRGIFRIAIKRFKPKHRPTGVHVSIRKQGSSRNEVYPKGFMGGTHKTQSVKLRGTPMERKGKERYPIRAIPAINLTQEIRNAAGMVGDIASRLRDEYQKQVAERIRFLKVKLSGKLRNQIK